MPSPYIPDGFTKDTTIEACEQWDAITVTYRPMAAADFAAYASRMKGADDAAWLGTLPELIAAKVVSWNITGPDGSPVAVSRESIGRLVQPLMLRLWSIVSGSDDAGGGGKN
jgi:hypothetical protein